MRVKKVFLYNMQKILDTNGTPIDAFHLEHKYFDQYYHLVMPAAKANPPRIAYYKGSVIIEIPDHREVTNEEA